MSIDRKCFDSNRLGDIQNSNVMYVWKKYLDTNFYDRELKVIFMRAKAVPNVFLTAKSSLCDPINIIRIDILEMRIYFYLCSQSNSPLPFAL